MTILKISEKEINSSNLEYVVSSLQDFVKGAGCKFNLLANQSRCLLHVDCEEYFKDIIKTEILIKIAEIVAINYKYTFFKKEIIFSGLCEREKEILLVALIAADLEEDKRYVYEKIKGLSEIAIDGVFNFRLRNLKKKWKEVSDYVPSGFFNTELKEFIRFLLENRKKAVYLENNNVYDYHYRKLTRTKLLPNKTLPLLKEIILSNCGEIRLLSDLKGEDEKYIKDYYKDKITFSNGQFC
ncbi:MAG: hypothetical protein J6Q32_04505 [Clostridia bacterium]|nr:hypothetical protein [Clostridia bacterium]